MKWLFLEGHGVFCIDVKPWRGTVSAHNQNWHVQVKEEDQHFTNTCIEQLEDPIKALVVIKTHTVASLRSATLRCVCDQPKCQMLPHTFVQGLFGCPAHRAPFDSSGLKRFWAIVTIYMEISNTTAGLSKLPKCPLFIRKALIMFMEGWRGLKQAGA